MGPEHETAFQVLCRWSAALGYILMAHLDGDTDLAEAAKVQSGHQKFFDLLALSAHCIR